MQMHMNMHMNMHMHVPAGCCLRLARGSAQAPQPYLILPRGGKGATQGESTAQEEGVGDAQRLGG